MAIKWSKKDVLAAFSAALEEPVAPAIDPEQTLQRILMAANGGTRTPMIPNNPAGGMNALP